MEAYLGTILAFGCDYPPMDWAQCQGQSLQISQNNALYAVIGSYYGGTPPNTFMLPNLAGRMPIGIGTLPASGPSPAVQFQPGNKGGNLAISILTANMPTHTHAFTGAGVTLQAAATPTNPLNVPSTTNNFLGASPATGQTQASIWSSSMTDPVNVGGITGTGSNSAAGGSQPISVQNPFLALNFCIAVSGLFPSRQ
ncbi:MAG: phage tail protein [Iodobacter sp.]